MNADRSFLYGVVALQAALIDSEQFSEFLEVCKDWDEERDGSFTDLFVGRGWIGPSDKAHLDYLVERRLQRHVGDAKVGLASVAREVERTLASLRNDKIQRSLAGASGSVSPLSPAPRVGPLSITEN